MSSVTIQLPESVRRNIELLAGEDGCTVDQFIASAAAEKVAALRTLDYLRNEAAKGNRQDFEQFLAASPEREPAEVDRLP